MNSSLSSSLPVITVGMGLYIKITGNKAMNHANAVKRTVFFEGTVTEINKTTFTVKTNKYNYIAKFKLSDHSALKSCNDFEIFYSEQDYLDVQNHVKKLKEVSENIYRRSNCSKSEQSQKITTETLMKICDLLGI